MPNEITIRGQNCEIRIFPEGDYYLWKILNSELYAIQDVQLRIESYQTFDSNKSAFRQLELFNCPWSRIPTLKAACETRPEIFIRFETDTLGFGKSWGEHLILWPDGDRSALRYWRLTMRVDGLPE